MQRRKDYYAVFMLIVNFLILWFLVSLIIEVVYSDDGSRNAHRFLRLPNRAFIVASNGWPSDE